MITSKINGVTKHQFGGENFIYYFATCIVNVSGDEIQYLYFNNETPFRFNFSSLTEKYSTTTAEGFVDYLANNDYFVIPVASTGSGSNVTIVGNTTDFSTGANQELIIAALDRDKDSQGKGVYYSDYETRSISLFQEMNERQKELLFFIKAIAE